MTVVPFDYSSLQTVAQNLLTQFGQIVNVSRQTVTGGTDYEPTSTTTNYPTQGVIVNLPRWYPAYADNADILRTDRLCYIVPPNGIKPTPFDTLVAADGTVYRIIDSKPISPSGVAVIYILQLRT